MACVGRKPRSSVAAPVCGSLGELRPHRGDATAGDPTARRVAPINVGVLAAELATVVEAYPDRQVRVIPAAPMPRVVVGGRLPHVSDEETRTLTAVLDRLVAEEPPAAPRRRPR